MLTEWRIGELVEAAWEHAPIVMSRVDGTIEWLEKTIRAVIAETVATERQGCALEVEWSRAELETYRDLVEHHKLHHQQEKIAKMQMARLGQELRDEWGNGTNADSCYIFEGGAT